MKKIVVATWNVGQDLENDEINEDSYKYIKSIIEENNIDIIAFQEAIAESNKLQPLSEYISQKTKLKYNKQFLLSPSDMNEKDKMGVAICSKFEISHNEKYLLENPNLIYKSTEETTIYSHDKGFNISKIQEMDAVVISGHCVPFHVFKESPLNFKGIYLKLEKKVLEAIQNEKNVILLGDFNYSQIYELFPNLKGKMNCIYENQNTRKGKQVDYILVTNNIKYSNFNIIRNRFDHALCIAEILIK